MNDDKTSESYETPQVRTLGSLAELTQGGGPGPGQGFPGGPDHGGRPFHSGSW